jgi:anaerobic magnesium-protoporphyrin IX monomethyl ester cyclase
MPIAIPLRLREESSAPVASRDTTRPVFLVGFQNQGNLGIGYLAAVVRQHGYAVRVFDFESDHAAILAAALADRPVVVGFSLIFQFYIHRFGDLIRLLRSHGVDCHFTMGGHFPSLSYRETLRILPDLDSVVRFEGEMTLLDLADRLGRGDEWRDLPGLAFRRNDEIVTNPLRALVDDLDGLPYPERDFRPMTELGHQIIPMLASRGCARTCSFCSIQTFYRTAPGKIVRTRKPRRVVEEMVALHREHGATIFLFQDDDFPLFGPVWRRWAADFVAELHRSGLPGRAIWKMNCRADSLDRDVFLALRDAGLYFVYMGLESGNEEGLKTLHKQISVEQNLRAVEILKDIGLMFEYGFMLFDPSSTFASVQANLGFLRQIIGDGSTAATFCRMLPYDGTAIKEDLERAGRLRGDTCHPDYDFLDPKLTLFYESLMDYVDIQGWIHGYEGLSMHLKTAWHEVALIERLFPPLPGMAAYRRDLQRVTRDSNEVLLGVVEDLCRQFTDGVPCAWRAWDVEEARKRFLTEVLTLRDGFVARHQDVLLAHMPQPGEPHGNCAIV